MIVHPTPKVARVSHTEGFLNKKSKLKHSCATVSHLNNPHGRTNAPECMVRNRKRPRLDDQKNVVSVLGVICAPESSSEIPNL
jgi:hypothetical protein